MVTTCDICKISTDTPASIVIRRWDSGEYRYLVCKICAATITKQIDVMRRQTNEVPH